MLDKLAGPVVATLLGLLIAVGLLIAGSAAATTSPEPAAGEKDGVQVTYLANEGFLLEAGETKVLIDALFGDGLRGYPVVPEPIRADLEAGRGRFAGVDLVLASHYHDDHFDAAAVARHLRANPSARFLSTRQAVAELERELGDDGARRRITGLLPAEGATDRLELPGIAVQVLNLHHGRSRRPLVENLGLVVRLGGVTFLHVGDTEAEEADLRPYRRELEPIDVWLLPSWLLGEPHWQAARARATGAGHQVAMHLMAPDAPASWFGAAKSLDGYVASLVEALPEAWVPLEPLATRHYAAPAR